MDTQDDPMVVAGRLRAARESIGFTQDEVSDALGIPRTSVNAIELGKRKVSALELRRLSRLYRKSVEWLLGEDAVEGVAAADAVLLRATSELTEADRAQVLRYAEFLAGGSTRSSSRK